MMRRFLKGLNVLFLSASVLIAPHGMAEPAVSPQTRPAKAVSVERDGKQAIPASIPIHLPTSLVPWREWALYRQEFRACPLIAGTTGATEEEFLCAWPDALALDVGNKGARFRQNWQVEAESWVPLPGDGEYWPQQVIVNGKALPVLDHEGPALRFKPGRYEVTGFIPWQERPQTLRIPESTGLVNLQVDGKVVLPVQREGEEVTLGRLAEPATQEADSLDLQVYRKLSDGIPAQLTTHIQIHVSGKAREVSLGPVLPEGFIPIAISSGWAARLGNDGRLQVQVKPGNNTVLLTARATAPLAQTVAVLPDHDWVSQEIWSYEARPDLRVTAVSPGKTDSVAALAVDPKQSGVPATWQNLPAFALENHSVLSIEERSRGLAAAEKNHLRLAREMWLNFDGNGFFARDKLAGDMSNGWRFDVAAPYALERANDETLGAAPDIGNALLITQGAKPGLSGVEWTNPQVDLAAGVRLDTGAGAGMNSLPIGGWQQSFDQVNVRLHLPNGYHLIAAPDTESASGSWIESWTLPKLLLAVFIIFLGWRVLGVPGGMLAALYVVLGLQEANAPLWTLIAALALALFARVVPAGWASRLLGQLKKMALTILSICALLFIVGQIRTALYPSLESVEFGFFGPVIFKLGTVVDEGSGQASLADARKEDMRANEPKREFDRNTVLQAEADKPAPLPSPLPVPAESPVRPKPMMKAMKEPVTATAGKAASMPLDQQINQMAQLSRMKQKMQNRYSQSTVVQTGSGEPDWSHGHQYDLRWSGSVEADRQMHLLISPPWLTRLLRMILVVALGALLWRLLRNGAKPGSPMQSGSAMQAVGRDEPSIRPAALLLSLAVTVVLALPGLWAEPVQAEPVLPQSGGLFPSDGLLQQMKERLTRAPECAPGCASLANAGIHVTGNELRLMLEAHAGEYVAVPLPTEGQNLSLVEAKVDGAAAGGLLRRESEPWLALTSGVHRIELRYRISGDNTSLRFPLLPKQVLFDGKGWATDDISENRLLNETLNFSRSEPAPGNKTAEGVEENGGMQQFPAYVRVMRELTFDLDWSTNTTVTRLAPRDGGLAYAVPLLSGEHVTTPGIKIEENRAMASIAGGQAQAFWQSRLDKAETLQLVAPTLAERTEVWRIRTNPLWHVAWSGVPVNPPVKGAEPVFEFYPLPGETLTLTISQPVATQGMTRAIDKVRLDSEIKPHAARYGLQFTLRASQGGEHVVMIPVVPGTSTPLEVLSVTRNDETLNLRPSNGRLTLPVLPGSQQFKIELRGNGDLSSLTQSPEFNLGLPSANIDLAVSLPPNRWVLTAFGPQQGPAMLIWTELLMVAVLAFGFCKALNKRWPNLAIVRFRHLLLLALGLSTLFYWNWYIWAIVVFWLCLLEWRKRQTGDGDLYGNGGNFFFLVQTGLLLLTLLVLWCLGMAVYSGLTQLPDMHGYHDFFNFSTNDHNWFADKSGNFLPVTWLFSLPLWVYRVLMLAWALWLVGAVVGWLRFGYDAWREGDGVWKSLFLGKTANTATDKGNRGT